ncbi:MAG: glycosyltransferase family 87 protein [Tepidisphaeraceae bacterium]
MLMRPPDVRRFNQLCGIAVLAWLLLIVSGLVIRRPSAQDFNQFYMASLIARHGYWDELYPVPRPLSTKNPGDPGDSDWRPRAAELQRLHTPGDWVRFMQPPPMAVLVYPLSLLSFDRAHLIWTIFGALAGWGIALQAGTIFTMLLGRQTRGRGLVVLLTGLSVLMYRAVRVGNISTELGWLIGCATIELIRRDGPRGAAAIALAGTIKYVGAVFFPVAIAMRRWRTLVWTIALGAGLLLLTFGVVGFGPFRVFAIEIAPTLGRSLLHPANQSAEGFLLRLWDATSLPHVPKLAFSIARLLVLVGVLALIFRVPRDAWRDPARVFAALAALVSWMLIFSPIFWDHYHVQLCPFWGWLIWEATRSRIRAILATFAIAMAWIPMAVVHPLPEPINSHQLWAACIMMGLAMSRLAWHRDFPINEQLNSPN